MDAFFERLIVRAATIDELLSDDFETAPGQKGDADLAARRLAAWCQSSTSGDWSLFGRRLARDGLTTDQVLPRLATVRRAASAPPPAWIDDAIWILSDMQNAPKGTGAKAALERNGPCAFEHLFTPVVGKAETLLWADIDASVCDLFTEDAEASSAASKPHTDRGTSHYDRFITEMKSGGLRSLFEQKSILLRLTATLVRQWIHTSRELIVRLGADLDAIRRELLPSGAAGRVANIAGEFSDPHNHGHSVQIIGFENGFRVVYKPKDLRLDVAWFALVERLNRAKPPLQLKAVRALARDGYGWAEFIDHAGTDADGCKRYFQRAGAWLALLHIFAANDMHQENMIAAADFPVPIDLETLLQPIGAERKSQDPAKQAQEAATEIVANSVMMVGLLPAYGRSPDNQVFAIGGMTADWNSRTRIAWNAINSDAMRPAKAKDVSPTTPNLPNVDGHYAKFADHIEDFIAGFEDYATFLLQQSKETKQGLFDGFAGLPVRRVIRATRFYYMLLQRLKNQKTMDDGAVWSAQIDFMARLADWENDTDPYWPLQRAERTALATLNVPHFTAPNDGDEISDAAGVAIHTGAPSGMDHARARLENFDEQDVAWQVMVIRQNTNALARAAGPSSARHEPKQPLLPKAMGKSAKNIFAAEADSIAAELAGYAIRRGPSAAWIGLDWLGDSDVFQLVCLGPDLYNGVSGIALFLAAHAGATGCQSSAELALAGLAQLRKNLHGRNAARFARSIGIGAATGLGAIVYALTAISKSLGDPGLLADAHAAARLFIDDLIAADKQLDVMGGAAGAILGLLRLHRDTQSHDALERAIRCGEHLLAQPRVGAEGRRSWSGQGSPPHGLNGMSHGAAGFSYALASLAAASGREDFATAAAECIAFEDSSYDANRHNWPDFRNGGEPGWPCQWCHGAPGIGLARIATSKRGALQSAQVTDDIRNALAGAEGGWPAQVDTLCCGTLGNIEFLCEASDALARNDLRDIAAQRLLALLQGGQASGDYRWNGGNRRFNLGLFRGLAGIGYTSLRQIDSALPNVLIWE